MRFEWDTHKATANLRKHGVSFADAKSAFNDPSAQIWADSSHSDWEDRFCLLAHSTLSARLLFVCHRYRGDDIHIISARKASASEYARYRTEKANAQRL